MASRGLVFRFTTDLAGAQKSIADFAANAVSMMSGMGGKAVESQKAFDAMGTAATGLKAAVAGFVVFEAAKFALESFRQGAAAAREELERLTKVSTDAKALGVGTTFLQQFTSDAEKLGVKAEDLTKVLEGLRDASKVSLGTAGDDDSQKSSAQKAIAEQIAAGNLGKSALANFDAAPDQMQRLRVVLDILAEMQRKKEQLASFDLGGKLLGSDFENRLRLDDQLVGKLQDRLRDMAAGQGPNVVPPEEIERARQLDEQMREIQSRIDNALRPYHNDVRAMQQDELAQLVTLKGYYADLVEIFAKIWSWSDSIGKSLGSWQIQGFFDKYNKWAESVGFTDPFAPKIDKRPVGPMAPQGFAPTPLPELTVTKPKGDASKPLPAAAKGGGHEEQDPIETYIDSLKKQTAAEEAEAGALGKSNRERQEAINLAKAQELAAAKGKTLSEDQIARIKQASDAYVGAKQKIDDFNLAQQRAREQAQFFGETFEQAVEGIAVQGNRLADVMLQVVKSLESAALKAVILGDGPLAAAFGMGPAAGATGTAAVGGVVGMVAKALPSFAGFFASGGTIPAGQVGIAGEKGPELIMGPATVEPRFSSSTFNGGARNNTSLTHAPTIVMPQGVTEGQAVAIVERSQRAFARNIMPILADKQRRFG